MAMWQARDATGSPLRSDSADILRGKAAEVAAGADAPAYATPINANTGTISVGNIQVPSAAGRGRNGTIDMKPETQYLLLPDGRLRQRPHANGRPGPDSQWRKWCDCDDAGRHLRLG